MPQFEPVLTANIHQPESHTLAAYQRAGGCQAIRKVLGGYLYSADFTLEDGEVVHDYLKA